MLRLIQKRLVVKSVGYRLFVVSYELALAYLVSLGYLDAFTGVKVGVVGFVILNNLLKTIAYYVWELIWTGLLRTRWNIVDRVLRWLGA